MKQLVTVLHTAIKNHQKSAENFMPLFQGCLLYQQHMTGVSRANRQILKNKLMFMGLYYESNVMVNY
jgi:hypothetical protein